MLTVTQVRRKFEVLAPFLDERQKRLWVGAEADAHGHGGITLLAEATGISRPTVSAGAAEVRALREHPRSVPGPGPTRRPGAGRKPLTETDPTLPEDLDRLVDPATRGDPQSPLRWSCKSTRRLAEELGRMGHDVSPRKVAQLLKGMGYSLQGTRKSLEGEDHPDRDAQFGHISDATIDFLERGQPAISVDAKKKELLGEYGQDGREWQPAGEPEEVRTHDFPKPDVPKAIPYGVYDLANDQGWVSVGADHDTAEFAVETIRQWWRRMGREAYPHAEELLISADGGGSNGSRSRLWKARLQDLADESGLRVKVCHFPPGTSKWNKIEHRMFNHISMNWRGRPLLSHEVVVNLIGGTTTREGLRIEAALDPGSYPTGIKIPDEEMEALSLERDDFHGEWNYTLSPRPKS
jgi:hypothetical protein